MPYTVYLKKGEEKRILGGHSWVYANEVQKIEGKDKNGSLAEVRAFDGRFVGKGYVNHLSKILVRIFIRTGEEDGKELYLKRIAAADLARKKLISDSCYRMVFAEADDLPALVVDRYGDYLVLECLSLGVDMRKNMIAECLNELFSPKGIYMRGDAAVRQKEGLSLKNETLSGEVPDKIYIEENGIKMAVDVKRGQKTGYFLDQKEKRGAQRLRKHRYALRRCVRGAARFQKAGALLRFRDIRPSRLLQERGGSERRRAGLPRREPERHEAGKAGRIPLDMFLFALHDAAPFRTGGGGSGARERASGKMPGSEGAGARPPRPSDRGRDELPQSALPADRLTPLPERQNIPYFYTFFSVLPAG